MQESVALRSGAELLLSHLKGGNELASSLLKQQALLFDRIGIRALGFYSYETKYASFTYGLSPELEYLKQENIVFDIEDEVSNIEREWKDHPLPPEANKSLSSISRKLSSISRAEEKRANEFNKFWRHLEDRYEESLENADEVELPIITIDTTERTDEEELKYWLDMDALSLRYWTIFLNFMTNHSLVTLLPYSTYAQKIHESRRTDVIQVTINRLPLPNNLTPWEKIIDYRKDEDAQRNVLALRRWMRKIASEKLLPAQIEEELDWLINEFQRYMRIHKMKTNIETLEIIVKAPLEIIENLVTLKFSKILDPLFAIKKRELSLLEAEINAPGKEIAYLIKTREIFDDDSG